MSTIVTSDLFSSKSANDDLFDNNNSSSSYPFQTDKRQFFRRSPSLKSNSSSSSSSSKCSIKGRPSKLAKGPLPPPRYPHDDHDLFLDDESKEDGGHGLMKFFQMEDQPDSEHWNSFYRRFGDKPLQQKKRSFFRRDGSTTTIWSTMMHYMSECTRPTSQDDDWFNEVPEHESYLNIHQENYKWHFHSDDSSVEADYQHN